MHLCLAEEGTRPVEALMASCLTDTAKSLRGLGADARRVPQHMCCTVPPRCAHLHPATHGVDDARPSLAVIHTKDTDDSQVDPLV
jgi:hypothetical protein